MNERLTQELALLRTRFPDIVYQEQGGWFYIPSYPLPQNLWVQDDLAVAFQAPPGYPAQKPYGFHVSPPLTLHSGAAVNNVTQSTEPPFPGSWLKFSWDFPEWQPTADVRTGCNLLNWALSFSDRLKQGA